MSRPKFRRSRVKCRLTRYNGAFSKMIPFCNEGDDYTVPWQSGGLSRCLVDIVGSLSSSGLLFILGLSGIVLRNKPQKRPWRPILLSKVFPFEIIVSIVFSLTFAVDLILSGVLRGGSIYGSLILVDCTSLCAWLFSTVLITGERWSVFYALPHGIPLVLFWILNALWLCVGVVSWHSKLWWWKLRTPQDIAHVAIFAVRCVLVLLLLAVGVLRPLFAKRRTYQLLLNADENPLSIQSQPREARSRSGDFVRKSEQGSTFANILRKCKLLLPYVWPKGHPLLQFQVLACFLILASGRVINLYVPIYYKVIVNALTPNSSQPVPQADTLLGVTVTPLGVTFPIGSIFIYVFLKFLQGGSVGSAGFSNNLRTFLWINVQQYTSRTMRVSMHN